MDDEFGIRKFQLVQLDNESTKRDPRNIVQILPQLSSPSHGTMVHKEDFKLVLSAALTTCNYLRESREK